MGNAWTFNNQPGIFLFFFQEERAYIELQRFEEKLNFEILIGKFPNYPQIY